MSTGRHEARRNKQLAKTSAEDIRQERERSEDALKKQKEKTQKIFLRQARARSSGGLFFRSDNETLG